MNLRRWDIKRTPSPKKRGGEPQSVFVFAEALEQGVAIKWHL